MRSQLSGLEKLDMGRVRRRTSRKARSAISVSKNSFQSAKSSLRWPLPRTCSSRIRVYLLCEFALQRKVRPFFCFKTQIYTKEFTLPQVVAQLAIGVYRKLVRRLDESISRVIRHSQTRGSGAVL